MEAWAIRGDSKKIGIAEAAFISMMTMPEKFKTFISVKASILEAGRLWIHKARPIKAQGDTTANEDIKNDA